MIHVLLMFIACFLVTKSAIAGPDMSDSQAKSLFDEYVKNGRFTIRLGTLRVIAPMEVSEIGNPAKGTLSQTDLRNYEAWQKVGLISLARDPGHFYKIIVTPTERGRSFAWKSSSEWLAIPVGTSTPSRLVKNEVRKKGVDEYRLVMVTFDTAYVPEVKAYFFRLKVLRSPPTESPTESQLSYLDTIRSIQSGK